MSRRRAFPRPLATVALIGLSAALLSACGGPGTAQTPGTWQTLASSPSARQEVSFVYSPSAKKFFLAGGHSPTQEAYDPRTDTWTSVAPLPAALDHIQSVERDGLIYYIGGLIAWPLPAVGSVYIYDPGSDRVSSGTPMPAGRERGAGGVAVYGDKIYYAGGLHAGVAVPWFDVYDTVTRTWSSLADMPEPRDHFQAGIVGARFYAIGGRNTSIDATTTVNDAFDFTAGAWVTGLAPLPTPRGGFATAVLGTKLVIIGVKEAVGHSRPLKRTTPARTRGRSSRRCPPRGTESRAPSATAASTSPMAAPHKEGPRRPAGTRCSSSPGRLRARDATPEPD